MDMELLDAEGYDHFQQGNGRSQRGQQQGDEEKNRNEAAYGKLAENMRQSNKDKARAFSGTDSEGKYGRHDGTTCNQRKQGVGQGRFA